MRSAFAAVFALLAAPAAAFAQEQPVASEAPGGMSLAPEASSSFTPEQREELRRLVRDYLLEHPEVLEEAILVLRDRRDAEEAELQRAAIAELQDQLYNDPRDFSVGPADAPIQIVEFFDYNCPYCRVSAPWVKDTLALYPDQVRFVFKESPIFADSKESSDVGARVAVAAHSDGRYLDFHFAMMEASGTIPVSQVRSIAEEAGLNWRRAQSVMESPETTQQLEDGLELLDAIGATGTPAFVLNGELIQGADLDRMDVLIASALEADVGGAGD